MGTFDGLHRGHQRVISAVKRIALERGLEPMVICFDRHPLETIAPERAPRLIQWPSERTNSLYREGLSILTLEFTPTLASLTAAEWLRKIHLEQGVDALVVGYDNTFGRDGVGMNVADYRKLGEEIGVDVIEASYEPKAGSSAIRKLLSGGDLEEANRLLGYPFAITGEVTVGKRIGHKLGYPTANITPSYRALLPKRGVYAVEVRMPDGETRPAVANIGLQPTVSYDSQERLEVHIPGFDGNLYGERLTVKFMRRMRDEMKFDSAEDLCRQIAEDLRQLQKTTI